MPTSTLGRPTTRPPRMVRRSRTLSIHNAHPRLRFDRRDVAAIVATLDTHAAKFLGGCPPGELSLAFLTDPAIAQIHGDFMNDPTATDVITFEGNKVAGLAGEICVSVDTAAQYVGLPAVDQSGPSVRTKRLDRSAGSGRESAPTKQSNFSSELTLYVIHGWLHLAGYDDLQPAKKRRMRAAEKRAMGLVKKARTKTIFRLV